MTSNQQYTMITTITGLLVMPNIAWSESIMVGHFEEGDLLNWTEKIFDQRTLYQVVEMDEKKAIQAISANSASGLYKKITIDLKKTPYLNWSWKIDSTLNNINERKKSGDDFSARIYVIFSGDLLFWRTRSLNYVWSNKQKVDCHWPNPYTAKTHMIAINSGNQKSGQWIHNKRNILKDFKQYFGKDIRFADAVAIMSDTDNTGQQAVSYYGNIFFSSE